MRVGGALRRRVSLFGVRSLWGLPTRAVARRPLRLRPPRAL
jgi:hypothetical protein